MMSTMSRMSAPIVVADLIEENAQLKARVAVLDGVMQELDKDRKPPPFYEGINMAKAFEKPIRADVTIARLVARVAEIEAHADDVEESQSLADRERDDALARVTELEEPQVGIVRCPNCDEEHTVSLSRGRTNDPNRPDKSGEGGSDGK